MILKNVIQPKIAVATLFTAMALVAFNLSQPSLQTNLASSFNRWYEEAAPKLVTSGDLKESDLNVRVSIILKDPSLAGPPAAWNLPSQSLADQADRENTGRVLQLIRESGVFGLAPIRNAQAAPASVAISVRDGDRQFETVVSLETVRENIQLMNLLKLLEVNANEPKKSDVIPERL